MKAPALALVLAAASVACAGPPAAPRSSPNAVPTVIEAAGEGDQRIADLGTCTTDGGAKIEECRIGYRTFGKLDKTKSNVVLFPTYFSGSTQNLAAGAPKWVDTTKFFLVLVDALGDGVSSGPSTSRTQPRLRFPKFTIHDMVETQRRLVREVLGVTKLHTVMGISMGGMQTFEWAVSHPDEVGHIVPVVGSPQLTAQDLLVWNAELHLLDDSVTYAKGEYAGRPPIPALRELHWAMLTTPAQRNEETSRHAFSGWDGQIAADAAFDWNDWHRQLEAMIAHDVARADGGELIVAAKRVKAKALVIVADQDHMVNPAPARTFAQAMGAEVVSLDTPCGHMAPDCDPSIPARVRQFLER